MEGRHTAAHNLLGFSLQHENCCFTCVSNQTLRRDGTDRKHKSEEWQMRGQIAGVMRKMLGKRAASTSHMTREGRLDRLALTLEERAMDRAWPWLQSTFRVIPRLASCIPRNRGQVPPSSPQNHSAAKTLILQPPWNIVPVLYFLKNYHVMMTIHFCFPIILHDFCIFYF